MKPFLCLFIFSYFFVCCTNKEITEGVVFEKEFRAAKIEMKTEERVKTHVRKGGVNHIPYTVSRRLSYPDRWVIRVCTEKMDTADFFVKKEVFDTVSIGSRFVLDTTKGTVNEPYRVLSSK